MNSLVLVHSSLALFAIILIVTCLCQAAVFFSNQGVLGINTVNNPSLYKKTFAEFTDTEFCHIKSCLLQDLILIGLFIVQHSLMASKKWKHLLLRYNICTCERLLYTIATCTTLTMVMLGWRSIPEVTLWLVNTDQHPFLWHFFTILHVAAWLILLQQAAIMDPMELIGIKQVTYYHRGMESPFTYLPYNIRSFYSHMRHGGPTVMSLMLWVHPTMTVDRVLLAALFTLYMNSAHRISNVEYRFACSYFSSRAADVRSGAAAG